MLEQSLLCVLPFQLCQLFRRHLTPVRRQRPIHLTADRKQRLFIRVSRQSRRKFSFEHSHAAFQIFQVQRSRRPQQRQRRLQLPRSLLKSHSQSLHTRTNTCSRSQLPGRSAQPLRITLQIFVQLIARKRLSRRSRRPHLWPTPGSGLRRFRRCVQYCVDAISQTLQLTPARRSPRPRPTLKRPINPLKHRFDRYSRLLPGLQDRPIQGRYEQMCPALPPEILLNLRKIIKVVKRFHERGKTQSVSFQAKRGTPLPLECGVSPPPSSARLASRPAYDESRITKSKVAANDPTPRASSKPRDAKASSSAPPPDSAPK